MADDLNTIISKLRKRQIGMQDVPPEYRSEVRKYFGLPEREEGYRGERAKDRFVRPSRDRQDRPKGRNTGRG